MNDPADRSPLPADADQRARARVLAAAAQDRKAEDVLALDVRGLTSLADTFLIASGASDRQVRAIAEAISLAARGAGLRELGVEGLEDARWVLLDFGEAIFHVFREDARAHYDLERLWGDAPRLELGDPAAPAREARR